MHTFELSASIFPTIGHSKPNEFATLHPFTHPDPRPTSPSWLIRRAPDSDPYRYQLPKRSRSGIHTYVLKLPPTFSLCSATGSYLMAPIAGLLRPYLYPGRTIKDMLAFRGWGIVSL